MSQLKDVVVIYTDGSCNNHTKNSGGYGVVLMFNDYRREIIGGQYINTTSIRMELMAVVVALEAISPSTPYPIRIHSDNQYVVNSVQKGWVFAWEEQMWFGRKNYDLWQRFLRVYRKFVKAPELVWVKGHSGIPENERCDQLASIGAAAKEIINDKQK